MGTKRLVQFIPYNITVSSTVLGAGGGGTIMALTEKLPPKGVPFSGFRYMKGKGFL